MKKFYFKIRGKFDFSAHHFEIGNPLIQSWHFTQNHLFKKIYSLAACEYAGFYDYHLQYFLQSNPGQQQKQFFEHLSRLTSERITYYKMQDPFSSRQKQYQSNLLKLESFQSFLSSIDQRGIRTQFLSSLFSVIYEDQNLPAPELLT